MQDDADYPLNPHIIVNSDNKDIIDYLEDSNCDSEYDHLKIRFRYNTNGGLGTSGGIHIEYLQVKVMYHADSLGAIM